MRLLRWLTRASTALLLASAAAAVAVLISSRHAKAPPPAARSYEPPPPVVPEASSLPGTGELTPLPADSGPLESTDTKKANN